MTTITVNLGDAFLFPLPSIRQQHFFVAVATTPANRYLFVSFSSIQGSGKNYDDSCIVDPDLDTGLISSIIKRSFVDYREVHECSVSDEVSSDGVITTSRLVRMVTKGHDTLSDNEKLKIVENARRGRFSKEIVERILQGGLNSRNLKRKHLETFEAGLKYLENLR
jgi:hypothetical protein